MTTLNSSAKSEKSLAENQKSCQQKTMTVKQVAETFEVSSEAIKQVVRKLFPNKMQNGKTTYLNEQEIACISKEMKTSFHLAHTEPTRIPCRLETTTELEVLANAASALTQLQELYNRKEAEYRARAEYQQYFTLRTFNKSTEKTGEQLLLNMEGITYFVNKYKVEKDTCKHCGEKVPAGHYCCLRCWNEYEGGKEID